MTLPIMDWLSADLDRSDAVKTGIGLLLLLLFIASLIWFGRKKLLITIPLVVIILLLAAIAIPGMVPAHSEARKDGCINNLRRIREAKIQWEQAVYRKPIISQEDLVGTNKYFHFMPACPSGGTYTIGAVNQNPTCSFAERGHTLE